MANFCNNTFSISHDDQVMIDRFEKAFNTTGAFQEFIPMPEGLKGSIAPCRDDAVKASNIQKYGAPDWYSWKIEHWGNKWDTISLDDDCCPVERDGDKLEGCFISAWSPPIEAFLKLGQLGFKFDLTYDEPGHAFIGTLSWDGKSLRDDCYSFNFSKFKEDGVDWRNEIPEEFHDTIEQYYEEWIEVQDDDEDVKVEVDR